MSRKKFVEKEVLRQLYGAIQIAAEGNRWFSEEQAVKLMCAIVLYTEKAHEKIKLCGGHMRIELMAKREPQGGDPEGGK